MEDEENDLDNLFEEYDNDEAPNEGNIENGNDPGTDDVPKTRVAPPRRAVKNPRLKFNPERLCGDRGIPVLVNHFKDVKFKGKGHEVEDLNKLLSNLEHWCHRLFPSMKFGDCLKQIERLGKKRPVQTCLRKIRLDMPILADDFVGENEDNDREEMENEFEPEMPPQDAFDRLISETPTSSYAPFASTPIPVKTTSEQKLGTYNATLTEEQKKRMEYNKLLAVERRKAKLEAEKYVETVSTYQSSDFFRDNQEPTSNNDAQFDSLINNHGDNIETTTIPSPKQTTPSFSSLVENSAENLELDDLVDLVDEDEDETLPLNRNKNDALGNNQYAVMVDLTNEDNNYSSVKGPTTVIDLEKEITENAVNNSSHSSTLKSLAGAEVVDLTGSHNGLDKIRPCEVVDLEKEAYVEDRQNAEIVLLDNELESYNQSNALFMDTEEISELQDTALTQHLNAENDIQSMEVE